MRNEEVLLFFSQLFAMRVTVTEYSAVPVTAVVRKNR